MTTLVDTHQSFNHHLHIYE